MNKKIVVITGANSGIGKAATIRFARAGYQVIMACRNMDKSKSIQKEIIEKNNQSSVDLMELDSSSFESIKEFGSSFRAKYEKLDILIHNAAYFNHGDPYRSSADQLELTFATNLFGPYLLTVLLKDHLKRSDDPRVLNAGSTIIRNFFNPGLTIDFRHVFKEERSSNKFSVYNSYRDSKMAFLMLTFKFADVLGQERIKVNMLEISGAKMAKETLKKFRFQYRLIAMFQNLYFPTTDKVAELYYSICTSNHFNETTGKLFNHNLKIMQSGKENPDPKTQISQLFGNEVYPRYAHDQATTDKIWALCKQVTGI